MLAGMNSDFIDGFQYFFQGLRCIWQPGLRRFVIGPAIVNIIIFTLLLIAEIHGLKALSHWIDSYLPSWLAWLGWLVSILLFLASVILFVFTFSIIANIIGTPFNGFLSEKVEKTLPNNSPLQSKAWHSFVTDLPVMLKRSMRMLLYYVPRAILCLILFLIPVVNIIASFIWFVFNAWAMSVMYIDYPADNHSLDFKSMLKQMRQRFWLCMGFGFPTMLMSMIPIINFFAMPAAVAGATIMYHEKFVD